MRAVKSKKFWLILKRLSAANQLDLSATQVDCLRCSYVGKGPTLGYPLA